MAEYEGDDHRSDATGRGRRQFLKLTGTATGPCRLWGVPATATSRRTSERGRYPIPRRTRSTNSFPSKSGGVRSADRRPPLGVHRPVDARSSGSAGRTNGLPRRRRGRTVREPDEAGPEHVPGLHREHPRGALIPACEHHQRGRSTPARVRRTSSGQSTPDRSASSPKTTRPCRSRTTSSPKFRTRTTRRISGSGSWVEPEAFPYNTGGVLGVGDSKRHLDVRAGFTI